MAAAGDISCPADSTAQHAVGPDEPEPAPAAAKCQGRQVAEVIKDRRPDVVLALGDLIQGQKSYKYAYNDFTRAWVGVLGKRIFSTVGNHDYHRNSSGNFTASGYFRYWRGRGVGARKSGKRNLGWSSWNRGGWHMINLNSNCFATDCSFSSRQLKWLVNDLRADRRNRKTQCTLAYFHHPLFSTGASRGRDKRGSLLVNLWEVLYRYRTDIVLNGHQHFYERFHPQNPGGKADPTGIKQFISGTGGAFTFPVENKIGRLARSSAASYRGLGSTFLKLGNGKYRSSFRDLRGKIHDKRGVTKCHRPNAGSKRREPRTRRYVAYVKKMATFDRKIGGLKKNIKRLRKSPYGSFKLVATQKKLRKTVNRRERVREQTLY